MHDGKRESLVDRLRLSLSKREGRSPNYAPATNGSGYLAGSGSANPGDARLLPEPKLRASDQRERVLGKER